MTATRPHLTESDMHRLLRDRYTKDSGNGPQYAYLTHVRDVAGFGATRTLDALALALWPSRGLDLHGFEIKCSRSDWLRELKDPTKAEVFAARCDRFWLVVSDPAIVADGELPAGWGLLAATPAGTALRCVTAAPPLDLTAEARTVSRSWLVCLLRAAGATDHGVSREELQRIRDDANEAARRGTDEVVNRMRQTVQTLTAELKAERQARASFFAAAGLPLRPGWSTPVPEQVRRAGAAVRAYLSGDDTVRRALTRLTNTQQTLQETLSAVTHAVNDMADGLTEHEESA